MNNSTELDCFYGRKNIESFGMISFHFNVVWQPFLHRSVALKAIQWTIFQQWRTLNLGYSQNYLFLLDQSSVDVLKTEGFNC